MPPKSPGTNGGLPLYSDVLNLSGVYGSSSSNATAPYALQMTYDPTVFANAIGSEGTAAAITQGLLYLGTYNGSKWISATDPSLNGTAGSAAQQNVGVTVAPGDTFAQWFATKDRHLGRLQGRESPAQVHVRSGQDSCRAVSATAPAA